MTERTSTPSTRIERTSTRRTMVVGTIVLAAIGSACGREVSPTPVAAVPAAVQPERAPLSGPSTMDRIVADLGRNAGPTDRPPTDGMSTMDRIVADLED